MRWLVVMVCKTPGDRGSIPPIGLDPFLPCRNRHRRLRKYNALDIMSGQLMVQSESKEFGFITADSKGKELL